MKKGEIVLRKYEDKDRDVGVEKDSEMQFVKDEHTDDEHKQKERAAFAAAFLAFL